MRRMAGIVRRADMKNSRYPGPKPADTGSSTAGAVPLEGGGASACCSNLFSGAGRECVGGDVNLDGDVAGAQHLDGLVLANGTLFDQVLHGDCATFREQLVELVQVYNLVLNPERVLEAAQLRQAHVQRQLAAGKASLDLVAGLRTLGTATSGLTLGTFTTTNTGLGSLGTRGGTQVVNLQCVLLLSSGALCLFGGVLLCHLLRLLYLYQVRNRVEHPDGHGVGGADNGVSDPLQAEGPQGVALVLLAANGGLDLSDLQLCVGDKHVLSHDSDTCLLVQESLDHCRRGDLVEREAAACCHCCRLFEALQRVNGRVNDVDGVGRTERLGEDVVDAHALQYCTDRATGDNTGTGGSRAQHDDACGGLTLNAVRDGAADAGNAEEGLLGLFNALRDSGRNFLCLAVADADHAVAVTDDDEGGEAEATTTLDDLGNAVDGYDALYELALLGLAAAVTATTAATVATALAAVATLATTSATTAVVSGSRRSGLSCRSSYSFSHLNVLFVIFGHSASPPSRAPSATAAIRPWYLLPPRSKTTASIPAALARSATSSPTRLALAVLSPSNARRSASRVEALATVRPLVSSTTWTNTWRAERLTTRRGRAAVPEMRLRIRSWRRLRPAALLLFVRFLLIAMAMVTYQPFRPCGG